jgi:hypothetical protein
MSGPQKPSIEDFIATAASGHFTNLKSGPNGKAADRGDFGWRRDADIQSG